jgi:hypothetical protein
MTVINLKRWRARQKWSDDVKKRVARFRRSGAYALPWGFTRECDEDIAKLTEDMVRQWALKLGYSAPIPERIRPFAELYHQLHPQEVADEVNFMKDQIRTD